MTNTYAINTTKGKEFWVADELSDMGLNPWIPKQLRSRYVKEKRSYVWYDAPYVPKLAFCVIPAVYWLDVVELKHILGKPYGLSRLDLHGIPAHKKAETGKPVAEVPGLIRFKQLVEGEYLDACRRRANESYQCKFSPGQALEILDGPFEGFRAHFQKVIKRAHDDYARLSVSVGIFGRETPIEIDPDFVEVV